MQPPDNLTCKKTEDETCDDEGCLALRQPAFKIDFGQRINNYQAIGGFLWTKKETNESFGIILGSRDQGIISALLIKICEYNPRIIRHNPLLTNH